ncbi:MAG: hypothetical protein GY737_24495 [Desulfobacteraceae bacterium]|nr:hypothetical protein [Desulfobacteraceae bacterium]
MNLRKCAKRLDSRKLSLKLYDSWVRQRQGRPRDLKCPESLKEVERIGLDNFKKQLAQPRREHLDSLRKFSSEIETSDIVALLVMMELPPLEISTLLHRLSAQIAEDPNAFYFSKVNMADNCGSGCG